MTIKSPYSPNMKMPDFPKPSKALLNTTQDAKLFETCT